MVLKKTIRKLNWQLYVAALLITIIVFGSGFWVGLQIEKNATAGVDASIAEVRQRSLSVETMLLMEESPQFCSFFVEEMNNFDSETYDLGQKIGYMEDRGQVEPQVKANYMMLELRDYLLLQRINKRCNMTSDVVLYFLSSADCASCRQQGDEITRARQGTSVRVYSFDAAINSTAISALQLSYNVTMYPTLIINGKKFSGLMAAKDITANLQRNLLVVEYG